MVELSDVEMAVVRDVFDFQKKRNFKFGKNKWYVIRDVGGATGVRYRIVGDVVDGLIKKGILRVKKKYGKTYLFLSEEGRRLAVKLFGDDFDKAKLDVLDGKIGRVNIMYREDDYWKVADFINEWLRKRGLKVRWSDEATNYLDYRVSSIDGPVDVMRELYEEAKVKLGGVAEKVSFVGGEDLAEYYDIERMRIGYALSDMDGSNEYRWRTQRHFRA